LANEKTSLFTAQSSDVEMLARSEQERELERERDRVRMREREQDRERIKELEKVKAKLEEDVRSFRERASSLEKSLAQGVSTNYNLIVNHSSDTLLPYYECLLP